MKPEPKRKSAQTNAARNSNDIKIQLPMVSHKDGGKWSHIDYEKHIVSNIPWDEITVSPPEDMKILEKRMVDGVVIDVATGRSSERFVEDGDGTPPRISEWAAAVSDIIPNAWNASRIIQDYWSSLNMPPQLIKTNEKDLLSILVESLKAEIIRHAEKIFREKIRNKTIRFDMQEKSTIFKMHNTYHITPGEGGENLLEKKERREPVQLSLFEPVYKEDFETDPERLFAQYLDEAKAIEWWHRVAARNKSEYYLRGWKKDKIYPDFIAVFSRDDKRVLRIYETKGAHLGTNEDTKYKDKVLSLLGETLTAGNMRITGNRILEGDFKIVLEGDVDNSVQTGIVEGRPATPMSLQPHKPLAKG